CLKLLATKRLSLLRHRPELTGPGEARASGQRGPRTDRGGDVAEIDGTPLGQHLRCRGGHEPDAMRARPDCHGHFPPVCLVGLTTPPSAAITSALRGRPTARLAMAPSGPSTSTVGVLLIRSRLTRSSRAAASTSTWVTSSTMPATWVRICR